MNEKNLSYRQIFKATTIFGSVQIFQILIQIIRSKILAILLGPSGIGILGLLNSTIGMISGFTSMGLGTSAVKDISIAVETGNDKRISIITKVFKNLVWVTGFIGLILTAFFSTWLSKITFGNKSYTIAFIWISLSLLFNQLTIGQLGILQGMRKLKSLAMSNLIGSLLGLIITIPLYFILRIDAIVPSIIISSFISMIISMYYVNRTKIQPVKVSFLRTFAEGRNMISMGFVISLSVVFTLATSYILRVYIGRNGNISEVGLYTAGIAIVTTYVGMIFNAMGADFYPRLSSAAENTISCNNIINQQAEIAILILAPILSIFFIFINKIIIILYSEKFNAIDIMIFWAGLAMFFRVIIWLMGFLFLVKGTSKLYFWNEFISTFYTLLFNIIGYHVGGITGIGFSLFISYFIAMVQAIIIGRFKFKFKFEAQFLIIFIIQFLIAAMAILIANYLQNPYKYIWGVLIIIASSAYSYFEINKRIQIKKLLMK